MRREHFGLGLLCVLLLFAAARGSEIYVPDDYAAIQDAIYASADGDTIIVRPGTYFENIGFIGKRITVKSEKGPEATLIDGSRFMSVVSFVFGEDHDSVLEGFTLTNGLSYWGGGIFCYGSSPLIRNVVVKENIGINGGGICFWGGAGPEIRDSALEGNDAFYGGGGIMLISSDAIIKNDRFSKNRIIAKSGKGGRDVKEEFGGGIYSYSSSPEISGNTFIKNEAGGGTERRGYGGALCCKGSGSPLVASNLFVSNEATFGAALSFLDGATATVSCCTATDNRTKNNGRGGGIYLSDGAAAVLSNTILWADHAGGGGNEICLAEAGDPSTLSVSYSDVKGGQSGAFVGTGCNLDWGDGMIEAEPLFFEAAAGDMHLTYDSPCRGTGKSDLVPENLGTDFEGDRRIAGAEVDMGADEFWVHLYHTGEAAPGGRIDVRVVGNPGTGPVVIGLGSGIQDPPKPIIFGDLYLLPPLLNHWNYGAIPASGILEIPVTLPGTWDPDKEHPFQALIGPWTNSKSKLTNLMVL